MGFGSSFAGNFIGGFQSDAARQREQNQRDAERQQQRDDSVFSALANSEDPDVRAAAVTGLLTNNHPAGALDKFFGKMREHPAYESIKNLVANGHQPFLSASDEAAKMKGADVRGTIEGTTTAANAAKDAQGNPLLTPGDVKHAVMGRLGAAQSVKPLQHGTIFHSDGTSELGSYDPNTGYYYGADQNFIDEPGLRFSTSGAVAGGGGGSATAGGAWKTMTGAQLRQDFPQLANEKYKDTDYVSLRVQANGQPVPGATPVHTQAPSSFSDHYSFFPTGTGIGSGVASGPHAGTVNQTAPGGAGVQHAEPPATTATNYRADIQQILAIHPPPKSTSPFFPVTPAQQQTWQAAVDAEAKKRGYDSWDALQSLAGGATRATSAQTPPPPVVTAPPPAGVSAPGAPKKGDKVGSGPAPTVNPSINNPLDPFDILH